MAITPLDLFDTSIAQLQTLVAFLRSPDGVKVEVTQTRIRLLCM